MVEEPEANVPSATKGRRIACCIPAGTCVSATTALSHYIEVDEDYVLFAERPSETSSGPIAPRKSQKKKSSLRRNKNQILVGLLDFMSHSYFSFKSLVV